MATIDFNKKSRTIPWTRRDEKNLRAAEGDKKTQLQAKKAKARRQTPLTDAYRAGGAAGNEFGQQLGSLWDAAVDTVAPLAPYKRAIMDTMVNKAYQASPLPEVVETWQQSSPDSFANAEAGMGYAQMLPVVRAVPGAVSLMNSVTDQFRTRNEGFYSGNLRKKIDGMVKNTQAAVPEMLQSIVDPQVRAEIATLGTGRERRREMQEGNPRVYAGSVLATNAMNQQKQNTPYQADSVAADLPTYKSQVASRHRVTDQADLNVALNPSKLPSKYADRLWQRTQNIFKGEFEKPRGKEWLARRAFNPQGENWDDTVVNVVDPRSGFTGFSGEIAGQNPQYGSRLTMALTNRKGIDLHAEKTGKPFEAWGAEDYVDYMQVRAFSNTKGPAWEGIDAAVPDEYKPKSWGPSSARDRYYTARKRKEAGAKLNAQQQAIYDAVEANKGKGPQPSIMPDGTVEWWDSFVGTDQALGGVGKVGILDPKIAKAYVQGYDGHDILGANPSGGAPLWHVTPALELDVGKKNSELFTTNDPAYQKKMETAQADFENKYGVKKQSGEGQLDYERRAFEEIAAGVTPRAQDYADVAQTGMLTGVALSGGTPQTTEEDQQ